MINCPNCRKPLDDNVRFCDSCGAQVHPTVQCPNCGKESPAEYAFCQYCGSPLKAAVSANAAPVAAPAATASEPAPTASAAPASPAAASVPLTAPAAPAAPAAAPFAAPAAPVAKPRKKIPAKWIGLGAAVVAVIAVIAVVLSMFVGKSAANYSFYIKDKELFYTDFSKNGIQQVSSSLSGGVSQSSLINQSSYLGFYITLSNDGKTMFFVDKISSSDDGANLYYRRANRANQEPTKIDSDVMLYWLNDDATVVTYLKGDGDADLYQYRLKKMEKTKIDSAVDDVRVSADGKKLIYLNEEGGLYLKDGKKDKEKLDSDVETLACVSADFSTVYYCKDDALFKKAAGGDRVKLASDISSVLGVYESGEAYYLKKFEETLTLSDYVDDDFKETDAAMTKPTYPSYPYSWNYDDRDEYEAAYEAYQQAYEQYQEDSQAYREKETRDRLRTRLADYTMKQTDYSLCYADESGETVLTDAYVEYSATVASQNATAVFKAYNRTAVDKVKLSEVRSASDVKDMVESALSDSTTFYAAAKGSATAIEQTYPDNFRISQNGDTVYFVSTADGKADTGDLYKMAVSDGKVQAAELYDTDVIGTYAAFLSNGRFAYFKNIKQSKGELYIDKAKVDDDVSYEYFNYSFGYFEKNDTLAYFTDYNSGKEYGTLKVYKDGKVTKVADEAHRFAFSPKGDLLYLTDYSTSSDKGTLFRFNGKKSQKLDEDVMAIIPYLNAENREAVLKSL